MGAAYPQTSSFSHGLLADRAKTLDRNGNEHHSNPAGLPADINLRLAGAPESILRVAAVRSRFHTICKQTVRKLWTVTAMSIIRIRPAFPRI
jgi:hypothetical protein